MNSAEVSFYADAIYEAKTRNGATPDAGYLATGPSSKEK